MDFAAYGQSNFTSKILRCLSSAKLYPILTQYIWRATRGLHRHTGKIPHRILFRARQGREIRAPHAGLSEDLPHVCRYLRARLDVGGLSLQEHLQRQGHGYRPCGEDEGWRLLGHTVQVLQRRDAHRQTGCRLLSSECHKGGHLLLCLRPAALSRVSQDLCQ